MSRIFDGKKLLEWETNDSSEDKRLSRNYPFWMRLIGISIFLCIFESLIFLLLSFAFLLLRFGTEGFTTDLFLTVLKLSFWIGIPLGIVSTIIYSASYYFKDRVVIRQKSINSRFAGEEQKIKIKSLYCYSFGWLPDQDNEKGLSKRYLYLVELNKEFGHAIELPTHISEEMINEVFQGRLDRDDAFNGKMPN